MKKKEKAESELVQPLKYSKYKHTCRFFVKILFDNELFEKKNEL